MRHCSARYASVYHNWLRSDHYWRAFTTKLLSRFPCVYFKYSGDMGAGRGACVGKEHAYLTHMRRVHSENGGPRTEARAGTWQMTMFTRDKEIRMQVLRGAVGQCLGAGRPAACWRAVHRLCDPYVRSYINMM